MIEKSNLQNMLYTVLISKGFGSSFKSTEQPYNVHNYPAIREYTVKGPVKFESLYRLLQSPWQVISFPYISISLSIKSEQ